MLLWLGWQAQRIGWNVWGRGIAASCYCLFYLGVVRHRGCSIPMARRAERRAAPGPFVVLLVLGQFGSVGLAGNSLVKTGLAGNIFPPAEPPAGGISGISRCRSVEFLLKNCRAAAIR